MGKYQKSFDLADFYDTICIFQNEIVVQFLSLEFLCMYIFKRSQEQESPPA